MKNNDHLKYVFLFIGLVLLAALFFFPATSSKPLVQNTILQAPADIVDLANQATMTDYAKQIFYATYPQIDHDRNLFDQHCQAPISSKFVELGCYTSDNRIYILNIDQPQLREQMAVTAAHEMLHAAYAKLSDADRLNIGQELEWEIPLLANRDLAKRMREYRLTEPGQRDNELHSILGTEYSPLSAPLEQYYQKYFTNRQLIVNYAQQFKGIFSSLENQLNSLLVQIKQVKRRMTADLRRGNIQGYNNLVPQINSLVTQYNQEVEQYNSLSRSLLGQESTSPED